jgi:hypothetical protein
MRRQFLLHFNAPCIQLLRQYYLTFKIKNGVKISNYDITAVFMEVFDLSIINKITRGQNTFRTYRAIEIVNVFEMEFCWEKDINDKWLMTYFLIPPTYFDREKINLSD